MAAGETVSPGHYVVDCPFVVPESCGCAGGGLGAELAQADLVHLGLACRELYARGPNQATSDAIFRFASELSGQLGEEATAPAAVARLNQCVAEIQLGLSKAVLNERSDAYYELRKAIRRCSSTTSPDLPTVRTAAQRLLNHLGAIYDLDGHEIVVTASVGVAMSATGYERPEDVLRHADIAMYRAKAAGRGIFAIYDSPMHATAMARLRTETELRQAISPGTRARSRWSSTTSRS
jgi:hypothetical protein